MTDTLASYRAAQASSVSLNAGLEPMASASVDELRQHQVERLRWSLAHAYANVPLYRERFDRLGVHPSDLKQLDDLALFPFTTKADLREHYPYGMFAVPMSEVVRLHASSGTTGKPTVVGYTQRDIDTWATLMARSIQAAGGRKGDKVHIGYGYGLFTGGLGAHYGAERLGCTVIPMSGGQTEKQVRLIRDFDPDLIMVTPSYMLTLADEMQRQGVDPGTLSLRLGLFGAEPWTEALRGAIERRLGVQAHDIYGLSEIMGPGVAVECSDSRGHPTLWEDHFYPEIIDPATGQVVPDGAFGELVLTSLSKEAMPMVRYRTRDLTRLLPGVNRPMRRMDKITGRSDDMLIIRGVNLFPTQVEEQVLNVPALCECYELRLYRQGHLDAVDVQVELNPAHQHLGPTEQAAVCSQLAQQIKAHIGISARVLLRPMGSLKRSEGKACHVVDERT